MKYIGVIVICITFMIGVCSAAILQNTVELRDFSGLAICPGNGLIAARMDMPSISENRVGHEWRIIDWPSGNVRFSADAGESLNVAGFLEPSYPEWSPGCKWLYYRALHDGEVQVWRLNAISGVKEKLTSDDADILHFSLVDNGQALVYETSASRGAILAAEAREYKNGILIDENTWLWANLTRTLPIFGRWAPYRRWDKRTSGHLLSQDQATYKTIVIRDREVRKASDSEIAELAKPDVDWVPKPNIGFLISRTENHAALVLKRNETVYGSPLLSGLASVRRENPSEIHECYNSRCTAEYLILLKWSTDESSIYFIAEQKRGAAGIYEWTPASGEVRTILETDGTLGTLASGARRYRSGPCPIIDNTAFCTAADPKNPTRLLAISLTSGYFKTVADPNAEIRNQFVLKSERISWNDRLGREIIGVLIYPRDFRKGTRYPLVITTYVCRGFLSGGIADGGPEYVLAENGFLVLCIDRNPNIHDRLGRQYSNAEARYKSALAEYESAVDMLVEKGLANSDRVGITGLSFSAQAVSYALTHSTLFHVAALRSIAVVEPGREIFLRPGTPAADFVNKDHGLVGSEQNRKSVYKELSVTMRAERVTAPILVQASDSEYLGSLPAFAALQKLDKPIEMIVFPDETHQLYQPVHRFVNFTRNVDWLRFWLQGYEDRDPEKKEQYARWRKMRDEQCARHSSKSNLWYCRK